MHARSKSESNCYHRYNPITKMISKSFPSTLNNMNDVKEVISNIMKEDSNVINSKELNSWKEHFLESKLSSATSHIQRLEGNIEDGSWNDERIKSVSQAMKQFVQKSENKEIETKEKRKSLQLEICKQKEYVENVKNQQEQQNGECEKKMQKQKNEDSVEREKIQFMLVEKNEEVNKLKKKYDRIDKKFLKLEREKEEEGVHDVDLEGNLMNDIEEFRKELNYKDYEKHEMEEEILARSAEIHTLKARETNQNAEIICKNQVIAQKDATIEVTKEEMKTLEVGYNKLQNLNYLQENKIKQLTEVEIVLSERVESFKKKFEECVKEKETAEEKLDSYKKSMQKEDSAQRKYINELKQNNENLSTSLNSSEVKIRNLNKELEESASREKMLEDKLSKHLSDQKVVKETNFAPEHKLQEELTKITKELCLCRELQVRDRAESEVLKEAIKNSEEEQRKHWYGTEHELCSAQKINEKLKIDLHDSISVKDKQETVIRTLHQQVEESKVLVEETEREISSLLLKCEYLTQEVEKHTTEYGNEDFKTTCCEKKELQNTYKDLVTKHSELQKHLTEQTTALRLNDLKFENTEKNEKKNLERIQQLEIECSSSRRALCEIKNFMVYTRSEIGGLRNENQNEIDVNNSLKKQIESIQNQNIELNRCCEKYKNELVQCECELRKKCDVISDYKIQLEDIQKKVVALKRSMTDKEKQYTRLMEEIEKKAKENKYFKEESYRMFSNLEVTQKERLTLAQNLDDVKRENALLLKENISLKNEKEKLVENINNEMKKVENLKLVNDRKYEEQLRDAEKKLDEVERKCQRSLEDIKTDLHGKLKKKDNVWEEMSETLIQSENDFHDLSKEMKLIECELEKVNKKLSLSEEELQQKKLESERLKTENRETEFSKETLQCQLKSSKECLAQLKHKNDQLLGMLRNFKDKQDNFNEESHNYNLSSKELHNENIHLKSENKKYQEEMVELKANISKLQGIIDGNEYKHSWIMQHDKEQDNQVKYLKQTISDLQLQVIDMKEQLIRFEFLKEKSSEEALSRTTQIKEMTVENKKLQEQIQKQKAQDHHVIATMEKEIVVFNKRGEENIQQYDTLKLEYDEMAKCVYEQGGSIEVLKEKYINVKEDLESEKLNLQNTTHVKKKLEAEKVKSKGEFIKVVTLLKQMKKEKDSLKAVLMSCEEEKSRVKRSYNQQLTDMAKLRKSMNESMEEQKKVIGDNELMKSKLNIMKFTESERANENKILIDKLKDAQIKLTESRKQETEDTIHNLDSEIRNPNEVKGYVEKVDMFRELREVLKGIKEHRVSSKLQDMKIFLEDFKNSESERKQLQQSFKPKIQIKKKPRPNNSINDSSKKLSKLFEQSRNLQTSLISDMKNLTERFVVNATL